MKILHFIPALRSGGAERFTVDICNELSKEHEVYLCTIINDSIDGVDFYKSEISKTVHYINLGFKKGYSIKIIFSFCRLLYKLKPDIVNAHLNIMIYLYLPALLFPKIKFYHTLHNLANMCVTFFFERIVNKLFYEYKICPITISEMCKKSYEDYYKINNSVLIKNGRSEGCLSDHYLDIKRAVFNMKNHNDDLIYIHIARCHEQKNQIVLIDAFNKLIVDDEHAILLIIGDGFETELGMSLKKRALKCIFFLGEEKNVFDYLKCSDFFCLSSLWEGLPITLLEAMSCGVIPICTPAGGIPDVIQNGVTGILANDFTVLAYHNSLLQSIRNCNVTNERVKQLYLDSYSIGACTIKYQNLYKSGFRII